VTWEGLCLEILGCKPELDNVRWRYLALCEGQFPGTSVNDGWYSECDSNLTRLEFHENNEDYSWELVYDTTSGELVSAWWSGELSRCDGADVDDPTVVDIRTGPRTPVTGCRTCTFCRGEDSGQAGASSQEDCVLNSQGRISLP
jgi:hypothetical protein